MLCIQESEIISQEGDDLFSVLLRSAAVYSLYTVLSRSAAVYIVCILYCHVLQRSIVISCILYCHVLSRSIVCILYCHVLPRSSLYKLYCHVLQRSIVCILYKLKVSPVLQINRSFQWFLIIGVSSFSSGELYLVVEPLFHPE